MQQPVRVLGCEIKSLRRHRTHIGKAQFGNELIAVIQGFLKQLSRIQENNRQAWVDFGNHMKQHDGFRTEG